MIILLLKHFFLPVSNDDTEALFAIDFDDGGLWQAHMSHKFGLVDGGQRVECCVVDVAVAEVWIDGEVSHAERGEILEKVCALTWIDAVVL